MCRTLLALLILATPALAQLRATRITTGSTGFTQPLFATPAPNGAPNILYVVEKTGTIRTINTASPSATPQSFFNYASVTGSTFANVGEGGLLGLAFHPDFQTNRTFYTYSTADSGNNIRVDQFKTNANGTVDYNSRVNVVTVAHPGQTNHYGGWIGFKPGDYGPHLYIATGDGGSASDPNNNSQNTSSLLGKMLRLDVGNGLTSANGYAIPGGNMTVNPNGNLNNPAPPTTAVASEIFAYGLRNPFRNSFDAGNPLTGAGRGNLYIGDVGQGTREEIDFIARSRVNSGVLDQNPGSLNGINFGWRVREGTIATPSVGSNQLRNDNVEPAFDYVRTNGAAPFFGSSVTGGYVYRGAPFADASGTNGDLQGTYIFGDYISGQIGTFRTDPATGVIIPGSVINRTSEVTSSGAVINGLASFTHDGYGNLYYLNLNNGDIYRFVPAPEPWLALPLAFLLLRRKLFQ